MTKTAVRPGHETEQALLDAAERLLVEVGAAGITTRRVAEEAGANHGLVHYYFGSVEQLLVRVLERFTERLIERQRQMYAADAPFLEKWRTAMAYLEEDRPYQKIWFELQALAWNRPELQRAARTGARRVARRAHRGVRTRPRAARARAAARGAGHARVHVQRGDHARAALGDRDRTPGAARLDRRLARGEDAMTVVERPTAHEQTRARYPDEEGYVERDGVRIFYEVYGEGEPTVFLLPTWSIVHSRHWKMQIPYLARHCRVLTFDGRGNGRSDRPPEPDAYREEEFAADALAVMDATATERAVLVSLSRGAERSLHARRGPPGAGRRMVFIAPASAAAAGAPRAHERYRTFDEQRDDHDGWGEVEPPLLARALRGLPRVLLLAVLHRAALHEAARGRGRLGRSRRTPETLVATQLDAAAPDEESVRELCARDRLPGARDPRTRRRRSPLRIRRSARGAGGRRARDRSRGRAISRTPATRSR